MAWGGVEVAATGEEGSLAFQLNRRGKGNAEKGEVKTGHWLHKTLEAMLLDRRQALSKAKDSVPLGVWCTGWLQTQLGSGTKLDRQMGLDILATLAVQVKEEKDVTEGVMLMALEHLSALAPSREAASLSPLPEGALQVVQMLVASRGEAQDAFRSALRLTFPQGESHGRPWMVSLFNAGESNGRPAMVSLFNAVHLVHALLPGVQKEHISATLQKARPP
ncbi:hypothetical protein T484DRAFT_1795003 [Baffinella frigidus]|nr:hypothetical protein T484DRAFT_1795003 [Cryptophyta sp. CCMP2293]